MTTFAVETTIDAPITAVWKTLADIGTISQWNPGVKASHVTSEQAEGVGACRHCDLGGQNFLDEQVVTWEPNRAITFRITDTNMPFKTADIRFTLQANKKNGTHVVCSPLYALKFGVVGTLLDKAFVRRSYASGMADLLAGLKAHVEQGERV